MQAGLCLFCLQGPYLKINSMDVLKNLWYVLYRILQNFEFTNMSQFKIFLYLSHIRLAKPQTRLHMTRLARAYTASGLTQA